jgi:hypothetical protein
MVGSDPSKRSTVLASVTEEGTRQIMLGIHQNINYNYIYLKISINYCMFNLARELISIY